jgi:hydrogenase-4 component B
LPPINPDKVMMNPQTLIVLSFASCGVGVLLSLLAPSSRQGTILAWLGGLAGAAMVAAGAIILMTGKVFTHSLWSLPTLGTLTCRLDSLSAMFVAVTGLVLVPASMFASGESSLDAQCSRRRPFTIMVLALYASILAILIAGDVLMFLLAWEMMSILCYLLIVSQKQNGNGDAEAGFFLLATGEAATLACMLGFLFLAVRAGSLDFAVIRSISPTLAAKTRWGVFILTFLGFGVKAGLLPVNFWVPRAYTAAPRAFVPILAGATLNLGLYGIIKVNADLMPMTQVGPGLIVVIIGTLSALVGILYATTENDLKTSHTARSKTRELQLPASVPEWFSSPPITMPSLRWRLSRAFITSSIIRFIKRSSFAAPAPWKPRLERATWTISAA